MKLAVCYENGQVFQHFGHTEQFKVYTIENGVITHSEIVSTNGQGHGALAGVLKELGAERPDLRRHRRRRPECPGSGRDRPLPRRHRKCRPLRRRPCKRHPAL